MSRLFLITLVHLVLGWLVVAFPGSSYYLGLFVLLLAFLHVIYTGNKKNESAKWAGYIVGLEVLLRMTGGFLVYEAGKYLVVLLLLLGLLLENIAMDRPWPIWIYGMLLVPSFAVVDFPDFFSFRSDVSFNLSGPLTLIVAGTYFYQRNLTLDQLTAILRMVVWPLVSVLVYLLLATPELSEIEYGTQSNFTASGGFGPNQVSTAMGLGVLIVGLALYFGRSITGFLAADVALMAMFLIRGFATFSRGGLIGGVAALVVLILMSIVLSKRVVRWGRLVLYMTGGIFVLILSWNYVNEVSENRLQYRYQGIDYRTGVAKDITSNRLFILEREIQLFLENPLFGIGPGMIRETTLRGNFIANTHSEFSRTLAEHGIFGVAALLIMVIYPFKVITRRPKEYWPILFAFLFLAFFTMFHSAMRLAMPAVLYSLSLFRPFQSHSRSVERAAQGVPVSGSGLQLEPNVT